MKKYMIFLALLLLTGLLYSADTDISKRPTSYWFSGNPDRDIAWNWMKDVDNTVNGSRGTGQVFYVDSNVNIEGAATTIDSARDTLEEAIQLCTADRGDIIYCAQGHHEDGAASTFVDADIAGISIIGLGVGSLKPTFDFTTSSTTFSIGADNITLANLRFVPDVTGVLVGVTIESGADYTNIINCDFGYAASSTVDEFVTSIYVGTSTGVVIDGCFIDAAVASPTSAISFDAATGLVIKNNYIRGDYSLANLSNANVCANGIRINGNTLINGVWVGLLNDQPVWEFNLDTSGTSENNKAVSNLGSMAAAFVGTGMYNFDNYYSELSSGTNTGFSISLVAATTTTKSIVPNSHGE